MSKEFGMYYIKNIERITKDYFYSVNKLNSNENIWDGYGHNQFSFNSDWQILVYNFSYLWHLELFAKKINYYEN